MRIAIVINTAWNIYNFRMNLVRALLAQGHEVVAIAPPDAYAQRLVEAGCRVVPVNMHRAVNPLADLKLIWKLYHLYKELKPQVALHYTIKPNIYGTLAAHRAGVPVISNVSGLGAAFITESYISVTVRWLYKLVFRYPEKVFFQNPDDLQLFLQHKLVQQSITEVLPGSGIDIKRFVPAPVFKRNQPFVFLMIARVLYDKGVAEFMEAARLLREVYPSVQFRLLGQLDEGNPSGIKREQLEQWLTAGNVTYLGVTDDIAAVIAQADCVVLPSYREGVPRTLLEAAAMGKPLVATDVPGCREVVQHGQNGFLCEVRNPADLAAKMAQLLALSDEELEKMGRKSRDLAVSRFDDTFVTQQYLKTIAGIAARYERASE